MSHIQTNDCPSDITQPRIILECRDKGGNWQTVPVLFTSSMDERPHQKGGCEGWSSLAIEAPIELRATFPEPVQRAHIRPSMRNPISCEMVGRSVILDLPQPRYLVLETVCGDGREGPSYTLYLLIDWIDENAPECGAPGVRALAAGHHAPDDLNPGDDDVLLLMPGVHTVENQMVELYSGKTLYLAGGAHLRSYVHGHCVENAAIRGHGVIDGTGVDCKSREWRDDGDAGFVFFRGGAGNVVDGPIIFDAPHWNLVTFGTQDTVIRNHKCITWKMNNDGIQPRSCNDMLVEHCFLKCGDDCIAVKTRRSAGMTSKNLLFRDLVLWNDEPGNAMEIGHTSQADVLENVTFENVSVVHLKDSGERSYTISINLIDHCHVRNITYRDIRVEGKRGGDFRFRIGTSRYTTDQQRGHINGVEVDGYHVGGHLTHSLIEGFDSEHTIRNVLLKDVTHHGSPPPSLNDLNVKGKDAGMVCSLKNHDRSETGSHALTE